MNSSTVLDVVEYYSIQSNVWCDLAPVPLAVQGAGAAFLDQKLYVVGGRGRSGYENRVWVCFCRSEIWRCNVLCSLMTKKHPHSIYDRNKHGVWLIFLSVSNFLVAKTWCMFFSFKRARIQVTCKNNTSMPAHCFGRLWLLICWYIGKRTVNFIIL